MSHTRQRVRKVVIPAAGLGTRFLPASKAVPKEMLPIVDKPVIQYIVEGAVASGIEDVVLVTSAGKRSIEDHFDRSPELEGRLEADKKWDLLEAVKRTSEMAHVISVRQGAPLGNGHAVLVARPAVGNEPFVMLWGDDLVIADPPVVQQLVDAYELTGGSVVAVMEVSPEVASRYGVIDVAETLEDGLYRVRSIVEKPRPEDAPSNLAAVAGYLLTPEVFDYLADTEPGAGGEIWLTDAVQRIAADGNLYALRFKGRRYDAGNKLEYLEATIDVALAHPELGQPLREYLDRLVGTARDDPAAAVG